MSHVTSAAVSYSADEWLSFSTLLCCRSCKDISLYEQHICAGGCTVWHAGPRPSWPAHLGDACAKCRGKRFDDHGEPLQVWWISVACPGIPSAFGILMPSLCWVIPSAGSASVPCLAPFLLRILRYSSGVRILVFRAWSCLPSTRFCRSDRSAVTICRGSDLSGQRTAAGAPFTSFFLDSSARSLTILAWRPCCAAASAARSSAQRAAAKEFHWLLLLMPGEVLVGMLREPLQELHDFGPDGGLMQLFRRTGCKLSTQVPDVLEHTWRRGPKGRLLLPGGLKFDAAWFWRR